MGAKYRAGITACGLIAEGAYLPAYRKIPQVEVVAGADLSPEVRERWEREQGICMYASAEDLLERERLDIVSICTWPPLRPEMVELACAAGVKGILAEKPMAVDLAGCDRMIAAAERSGTVLAIGRQRRFHNRYINARELIDSGVTGDLVQITGYAGDLLTGGTHTAARTPWTSSPPEQCNAGICHMAALNSVPQRRSKQRLQSSVLTAQSSQRKGAHR